MSKTLYKRIPSLLAIAGCGVAVVFASAACSHRGDSDSSANQAFPDSVPQAVAITAKSLANGDASRFASVVSYPLPRPYPLKDIADSSAMVEYFPIMVDDSLRNVMRHASPDRWSADDFRGWTLDKGQYVWVDDSVYSVNYTSVSEKALRSMLAREEIMSLDSTLRDGWTPAFCLYGIDNGTIYRVDKSTAAHKHHHSHDSNSDSSAAYDDLPVDSGDVIVPPDALMSDEGPAYRLTVFQSGDDLHGHPSMIMTGHLVAEGSEGTRIYYFNDQQGDSAEYAYDNVDGSQQPEIVIVKAGHHPRHDRVKRAYWRDYISRRR